MGKFFRKYKKGKADIPPALKILKEFQQSRAEKQEEIELVRNEYALSLLLGEIGNECETEAPAVGNQHALEQ